MPDQEDFSAAFMADGFEAPPARKGAAGIADEWDAIEGRPEWSDEKVPLPARIQSIVTTQARGGQSWDRTAELLQAHLGLQDVEPLKQQYGLEAARAKQSREGESDLEYLARRSIPIGSAVGGAAREKRYKIALNKLQEGKASDQDFEVIARHERLQEIDAQTEGTVAGSAKGALARIPAYVGEAMGGKVIAGGAKAALLGRGALAAEGATAARVASPGLMTAGGLQRAAAATPGFLGRSAATAATSPSFWLEEGTKEYLHKPDTNAFQAYAPRLAYATAQVAVLGSLGKVGSSVPTVPGRLLARTGIGLAEQQGVDVGASALDDVSQKLVGKSLGISTRYGTLGALARGDEGALKNATVQALTFLAFAGMHEAQEPGRKPRITPDDYQKALDNLAGRGYTDKRANEHLEYLHGKLLEASEANPNLTREDAQQLFHGLKKGPVRDWMMKLADEFDPKTYRLEYQKALPAPREQPGPIEHPTIPLPDQLAKLEYQKQLKGRPDLRENPALDELFGPNAEPPSRPKPAEDIRANPDLDELFGPSAKTGAEALPEPPGGDFTGDFPSSAAVSGETSKAQGSRQTSDLAPGVGPEPGHGGDLKPGSEPTPAKGVYDPEQGLYRVPDHKTEGATVEAAWKELSGSFVGKWTSKGRAQNEGYFSKGKVQFEFDPAKFAEGEAEHGEKDVRIGSQTKMWQHPALQTVRFRGDPANESWKDLQEKFAKDWNPIRADLGLPPVHLEIVSPERRVGGGEYTGPERRAAEPAPVDRLAKLRERLGPRAAAAPKPEAAVAEGESPLEAGAKTGAEAEAARKKLVDDYPDFDSMPDQVKADLPESVFTLENMEAKGLTDREQKTVDLQLHGGLSLREAAKVLKVSYETVRKDGNAAMEKLGINESIFEGAVKEERGRRELQAAQQQLVRNRTGQVENVLTAETDPDATRRVITRQAKNDELIRQQLDELTERFEKANPFPTAEALDAFAGEVEALRRSFTGRTPAARESPRAGPEATGGPAEGGAGARSGQTDLFGNPVKHAPRPGKKGTQLTINEQLAAAWIDAAEAWADERGLTITGWDAGGRFKVGDRTFQVGKAEADFPVTATDGGPVPAAKEKPAPPLAEALDKVAESGPKLKPTKTGGRAASLGNLKQNREKRVTSQVRKDGGLDKEAFIKTYGKAEFDTIMELVKGGNIPDPFKDAKGKPGRNQLENLITNAEYKESYRTWDPSTNAFVPDPAALIDAIKENKQFATGVESAAGQSEIERRQAEYDRKREEDPNQPPKEERGEADDEFEAANQETEVEPGVRFLTGGPKNEPGPVTSFYDENTGGPGPAGPFDIRATVLKLFGLGSFVAKPSMRKALAEYRTHAQQLVTGAPSVGNVAVLAHELAHHLQTEGGLDLNPTQIPLAVTRALRNWDYVKNRKDKVLANEEGFAEYLRLSLTRQLAGKRLTNDQKAAEAFIDDYFEKAGYAPKLARVADLIAKWQEGTPLERARGQVSVTGKPATATGLTPGERTKGVVEDLAVAGREMFDERAASLQRLLAERKRIGGEDLPAGTDPYTVWRHFSPLSTHLADQMAGEGVQTFRRDKTGSWVQSTTGKPAEWITEGHDPADLRAGYKGWGGELGEALRWLTGSPTSPSRLGTWLIARHVVNEVKRGHTDLATEDQVGDFRRLLEFEERNHPEFVKKAEESLRRYTETMNQTLDTLVDVGDMKPEQAEALKELHPDYVPLFRVMEDTQFKQHMAKSREYMPELVRARRGSGRQIIDPFIALRARYQETARRVTRQLFDAALDKAIGQGISGMAKRHQLAPERRTVGASGVDQILDALGVDPQLRKQLVEQLGAGAVEYYAPAPWKPTGKNLYTMRVNGEPRTVEIGDRRLYDLLTNQQGDSSWSVRLARAVAAIPGLQSITRTVKAGATTASMVFHPRNITRDPWHYFQNAQGPGGFLGKVARLLAGHVQAFESAGRKAIGVGQRDPRTELYYQMGGEQLRELGGFAPRGPGAKSLRRVTGQTGTLKEAAIRSINKVKDVFELIGAGEHGPRMAEWMSALEEMGYTRAKVGAALEANPHESPIPLDALLQARVRAANATVDFGRQGSLIHEWNRVAPFLGAHMAGMSQEIRNFTAAAKDLGRGQFTPKARAIAGVLATYLGTELLHWLTYKDEDWYKELPPHIRHRWWVLGKGKDGGVVGVPKPPGLLIMLGAQFQELLRRESGSHPLQAEGLKTARKEATPRLLPVVANEGWDVIQNEGWNGRPIVPERRHPDLANIDQWVDYRLPYVLEQLTGGLASERATRPPTEAFTATRSVPAQSVDEFYARVKELETDEATAREKGRKFEGEAALRKLRHAESQLEDINRELRGERLGSGGKVVKVAPPSPERAQVLRQMRVRVARQALAR